jgi:phosphatidate cytidylyltransferase
MNPATKERLFDVSGALGHPVVLGVVVAVAVALALTPLVFLALAKLGKLTPEHRQELWRRYWSWLILIPLMMGPVLLGAAATIAAVCVMSLLCYREFARASGLFRERLLTALVALGILAVTFAVADNWYHLFLALPPLFIGVIAAGAITQDRPEGYVQRVGLSVFAFLLFGVCFGHLGFIANDRHFRPILFWLVTCVELNDIFAYLVGRTFGRRKLAPHTSPNKTIAGSVGALVLTTALAAALGVLVFRGTKLAHPAHLIALGLLISVGGQLGDLTLSSIKRDLGIKDWAATLPGHGGFLDRFNSLLWVAPAVFHYMHYVLPGGVGAGQEIRIISGGF